MTLRKRVLHAAEKSGVEGKAHELRKGINSLPEIYVVEELEWRRDTDLGELRWWCLIGTVNATSVRNHERAPLQVLTSRSRRQTWPATLNLPPTIPIAQVPQVVFKAPWWSEQPRRHPCIRRNAEFVSEYMVRGDALRSESDWRS